MADIMDTHNGTHTNNGKLNSALTLGIIGTALSGLTALGGLGCAAMSNGNGSYTSNKQKGSCINEEELYIERMMAYDKLATQKEMYENKMSNLRELTDAFFMSYQRDVDNSFNLYKYNRDNNDKINARIDELDKKIDVMQAIRPYQDALINNKIDTNALIADFNLARRTCRMIEGQLVLPSEPVVTGYGSYHTCNCNK